MARRSTAGGPITESLSACGNPGPRAPRTDPGICPAVPALYKERDFSLMPRRYASPFYLLVIWSDLSAAGDFLRFRTYLG